MSLLLEEEEGEHSQANQAVILKRILWKCSDLLVHIINKANEGHDYVQAIGQFQDAMEEASALWESNKHDKAVLCEIATCVAKMEAVLETFCDFLYRLSKWYAKPIYGNVRISVVTLSRNLINWAQASHEVQLKILTNGILFAEIKAIENLLPYLNEQEAAHLTSYLLHLINLCFVCYGFHLVYKFSGIDWTNILKQLTAVPNFCIKILSKSLACLMLDVVELDEDSVLILDEAEVKAILSAVENSDVRLPDFISSFTPEYSLLLLRSFCLYDPNQAVLLEQGSLLSLKNLLVKHRNDFTVQMYIYQLLLQLIKAPGLSFEQKLPQCSPSLLEAVKESIVEENIILKSAGMLILHHLQGGDVDPLIQSHFKETATLLSEKVVSAQPHGCFTCDLIEVSTNLLSFSSQGLKTLVHSNLIPALFEAITDIHADSIATGSISSCLPVILHCILKWSKEYKDLCRYVVRLDSLVSAVVQQLLVIGKQPFTWFNRFLVNTFLAIFLTCLQEEELCMQITDKNWAFVLSPWLQSSDQETHLSAFITACCLSHHLCDEKLLFLKESKEDKEELITRLAQAVELPHLNVPLSNGMVSISATQLIMSLKMLLLNVKIAFKPKRVLKEITTLLVNGGLAEIKMCCSYICALREVENSFKFESLNEICELPLEEILENFQEMEDADLSSLAVQATCAIQGPIIKEDDFMTGIQQSVCKAADLIQGMLDSTDFNFSLHNEQCDQLNVVLEELRPQFSSERGKAIGKHIANISAFEKIVKFTCKLAEYTISARTDMSFLQCLAILLSSMASLTDKSKHIRYEILSTELLIHVANITSFFLDLSDDDEMVLQGMTLNSCVILSNCAEERDFSILYTAPGVVDWPGLFAHWLLSPLESIRYYAKVLAGCVSLNDDQLFLLELTESEICTLLEMLKSASQSGFSLVSGFGCTFSAEEVLVMINNFLLSERNFSGILYSSRHDILDSLMCLLKHPDNAVKTHVCKIILILLNSLKFRRRAIAASLDNSLSRCVGEKEDSFLDFLSQCVLLGLSQGDSVDSEQREIFYDAETATNVAHCFQKLLSELAGHISEIIVKFEGRPLNITERSHPDFDMLVTTISNLFSFWSSCCMQVKDILLQQVHKNALVILHNFAMKIYTALLIPEEGSRSCERHLSLGPSFVQLSLCFLVWTQASEEICKIFIEHKFLSDYIRIFTGSRLSRSDKFERFVVTTYMSILLNCMQVSQIRVYYNVRWSKATDRWAFCTHQELRLITKFIIGFFACSFEIKDLLALTFDCEDAQAVLSLLQEAIEPKDARMPFYFNVPALCLLNSLSQLMLLASRHSEVKEHIQELITVLNCENAIEIIFKFISGGSKKEQLKACLLLWILTHLDTPPHPLVLSQSQMIKADLSIESDVKEVCECILIAADTSQLKDFKNLEYYAKWCYHNNFPQLSIHFCEKIMNLDCDNSLETIRLLKGKCCYHQYVENKKDLNLSSLSEDVKRQRYKECFAPNIMAINILGEALDLGYLDEEGSYMLDRAMMDCIFKANMLDSCNRCYLCRQKQQGKKLIKSHIIPHSILSLLVAEITGKKQVFYAASSAMRKAGTRLLAPSEMVYFMLCHKCEQVISIFGETQFSPRFFQKVYRQKDESVLPVQEQVITYGPWLYQFCISLLFRAIHWDPDEYLNDSAIYSVFKQCRTCVSSWTNHDEQEHTRPAVYVFISPPSAGTHEHIAYHYLNWFLQGGLFNHFGNHDETSLILRPSFFFVQISMVNIVVTFDQAVPFDQSFAINPLGGTYCVPPLGQRREQLPSPLWRLFIEASKSLKQLLLRSDPVLSVPLKQSEADYQPNPSSIGRVMAAAAIQPISEDIANMRGKKHHCFLPPLFKVTSIPKSIKLPKGHQILLHSNYTRGSNSGSTFFICVGNSGKYPLTRPYIIWHFYEPTSTITSGAFFSTNDFHVTDFLVGDKMMERKIFGRESFTVAKNRIPTIIKDLLKEKGFSCIFSLLHRVKSSIETSSSIPPFDTKCSQDRKCWYCRFLCQNCCLHHATYGRLFRGCHGMNMFCSESCQILSPGFLKNPPHVFVISSSQPPPNDIYIHCYPLSQQHQEITHLYVRLLNKKGAPTEIELAIYVGDGTESCPVHIPYVVFYSHHLCHQLFVEFFVSADLMATEPLPQVANENSWDAILQLNAANAIQKCLEKGDLLDLTLIQLAELAA